MAIKKPATQKATIDEIWDTVKGTNGSGLCQKVSDLEESFTDFSAAYTSHLSDNTAWQVQLSGDVGEIKGKIEAMTGPRVTSKDVMRWIITVGALMLAGYVVWGVVMGRITVSDAAGLIEAGTSVLPGG